MDDEPRCFADRFEAGRALASLLADHRSHNEVVLGLARGGMPVAYEVARALELELDVCVVRKLGFPRRPELAMGALARGTLVLNPELLHSGMLNPATVQRVAARESACLGERESAYRAGTEPVAIDGRGAIIVDDGLATGSSMLAAIQALRDQGAGPVTVGVPVAPASGAAAIARQADEVVCVSTPQPFVAVGQWYADFSEVDDDEVRRLLAGFGRGPVQGRPPPGRHTL